MSLLALEAVGKTYSDRRLLDGVSLLVAEGDRIGLLGPNGAGKSTLLRMLAGAEEPDEGRRTVRRGLRIGYLPQDPILDPQATVRDAIRAGIPGRQEVVDALDALHRTLAVGDVDGERLQRLLDEQAKLDERLEGVGGHDVEHRIESTIHDVGLSDPEQLCGPMSGGERRRVAIARLLIAEPELLLLDEPTNHLDAEVIDWLEDRLLQSRAALVLVTHDRYFLDRVVTRIIEVDRTALFGYDGAYSEYVMQRAARLEREARAESTRLNLLRRETAWIRRGAPARSTKARARVQRYDALVEAEPDQAERELTFRIPCGQRLGEKVLALHGVGKSFGERRILDGFDLEIGRGDRIGIVGPNGAGKSTLLQICLGRMPPDRGRVEIGPTVAFSAIDQRREGLDDRRTVFEEVGRGNDHIVVDGRAMRIESYLEAMLFDGSRARTRVGDLSGGERNRVLLAKLLATAGNVLVLDEPTNDLDLATLQVLEEALVAFAGAALIVSHDRWFLDRVATRIVHLDGQGAHRIWNGDLSRLLERLADERRAKAADRGSQRGTAASRPASRPRPPKLGSRERRELEGLPDRISAAEQAVAAVDARLADPAQYAGEPSRVQQLADERARAQAEVDALYARWEELESIATDG